jgi:hypothetical protein
MECERTHLELEGERLGLGARHSNIILSWCRWRILCEQSVQFGIQNSTGVHNCLSLVLRDRITARELRQVADDSTKHELSIKMAAWLSGYRYYDRLIFH